MTANELIELLRVFPPETKVVVEGYEEGYDDIVDVKQIKIKNAEMPRWFVGTYDNSNDNNAEIAVFINGANKGKDID
jgi:hypothetical protein